MMMCAMMMMFFTLQQQSESKQTVSDQPMPWAARGVSHTSRAKEPVPWAAVRFQLTRVSTRMTYARLR